GVPGRGAGAEAEGLDEGGGEAELRAHRHLGASPNPARLGHYRGGIGRLNSIGSHLRQSSLPPGAGSAAIALATARSWASWAQGANPQAYLGPVIIWRAGRID